MQHGRATCNQISLDKLEDILLDEQTCLQIETLQIEILQIETLQIETLQIETLQIEIYYYLQNPSR